MGADPQCLDLDECALDNSGCGDRRFVRCVNLAGAPPACMPIDLCAPDEAGRNVCGLARHWICTPRAGETPTCEPVDDCSADARGRNICGEARYWACFLRPGQDAICEDIDECEPDADGVAACGPVSQWRCTNRVGAAPRCEPRDPCSVDEEGRNHCGRANFWTCEGSPGEAAQCADIDECAIDEVTGRNACGVAGYWRCVNHEGRPPTCVDVDECEPDGDGVNGCGVARYWRCDNREGGPPECEDLDECAHDNGGCGEPAEVSCRNVDGGPPECEEVTACTPDEDGLNVCGVARYWECAAPEGSDPQCQDIDECLPDGRGRNACGDAEFWICVNREGAPPQCEDLDECQIDNGGCGDPEFVRCVNRLGAPPHCVDIDECLVDNGGCGSRELVRCTNLHGREPHCDRLDLCAADAGGANWCGAAAHWDCAFGLGQHPQCTDRDGCAVSNGVNGCGDARASICTDRVGAAPICVPCPAGTTNLDFDPSTGCEYACAASGPEICNGRDDNCNGLIDEGFDLSRDPAHCGACGLVCGDLPNAATTTCFAGRCLVARCAQGFRDVDGLGHNGCEQEVPARTLHVDAANIRPGADGSVEDPFRSIGEALAVAIPGDRIQVAPGVYPEAVEINVSSIILEGAGSGRVSLSPRTDEVGITIRASDVTVAGLTVTGGRRGVWMDGTAAVVQRIRLSDLFAINSATPHAPPREHADPAIGIFADDVTDLIITASRVIGIRGGNSSNGPAVGEPTLYGRGGAATGVLLQRVRGCRLEGVSVSQISGGAGGQLSPCCGFTVGGAGGAAYGVDITKSLACDVSGLDVTSVVGGRAGRSANVSSSGPTGASAIGVRVRGDAADTTLTDVRVSLVTAGDGGSGDSGSGNPVPIGGQGGDAIGVQLTGARGVSIDGVVIETVTGGDGGATANNNPNQNVSGRFGQGGAAIGLHVIGGAATTFRHGAVAMIRGGLRAAGGAAQIAHGQPDGVRLHDAGEVVVEHLSVDDIGREGGHPGVGLRVSRQLALVQLRNATISRATETCVNNESAAAILTVGHTNLHACGAPGAHDTPTIGDYIDAGPLYDRAPRFVHPAAGDLRLSPLSPLIDLAAPETPYGREPAPNGCRADLGAYGNTRSATPAPGPATPHCETP